MNLHPTWLCNLCGGEFKFTLISIRSRKDVEREEPYFCPYCGRENNILAERRTTFKKIGIFDDPESLEKVLKEEKEEKEDDKT